MKRCQSKQWDTRGNKGGSIQKTQSPEETDFIETGGEKISRRTESVSDSFKNLYYEQLETQTARGSESVCAAQAEARVTGVLATPGDPAGT